MAFTTTTTTVDTETIERLGQTTRRLTGGGNGTRSGRGGKLTGGNGPTPPGGGGSGGRDDHAPDDHAGRARLAVWIGVGAILMMFLTLSGAYVFRALRAGGGPAINLPEWLWVSTGLILASSAAFEAARRASRRDRHAAYRRWLTTSLALGCGFLLSQLLAWRALAMQGVYLATNPHSSFFYVLTGLHAIHLIGGLGALGYLLARAAQVGRIAGRTERAKVRQEAADAVGVYWHFMDALWVFLFALLFIWH